jgi:hypothetical protein
MIFRIEAQNKVLEECFGAVQKEVLWKYFDFRTW